MSGSPFEEGALALATLPLRNARDALVNVVAAPRAKRTALVALLAIPWSRDRVKEVGTRNLAAVISAAEPMPYLFSISWHLRQTLFELQSADLTYLEGKDGPRRKDAAVEARILARHFPAALKNRSSNLEILSSFRGLEGRAVEPFPAAWKDVSANLEILSSFRRTVSSGVEGRAYFHSERS